MFRFSEKILRPGLLGIFRCSGVQLQYCYTVVSMKREPRRHFSYPSQLRFSSLNMPPDPICNRCILGWAQLAPGILSSNWYTGLEPVVECGAPSPTFSHHELNLPE